MSTMTTKNLGLDDEDFCLTFLPEVERSFGIKFGQHDLSQVATFGEFSAVVLAKLPAASHTDCTTQQAFYKLRRALQPHTPLPLLPDTEWQNILPVGYWQRRQKVAALTQAIGV